MMNHLLSSEKCKEYRFIVIGQEAEDSGFGIQDSGKMEGGS
jgi:hypothetical protein